MNICHVITSLDPNDGGPPRVVLGLASTQAQLGAEVSVIFHQSPKSKTKVERLINQTPGHNRVKFIPVVSNNLFEKITTFRFHKKLSSIVPSIDILHLHGIWEPLLLSASRLSLKYNIPYVVTPHGMLNSQHISNRKPFLKKILLKLFTQKMLNRASVVHALNKAEKNSYPPLKLSTSIKIIPNGVNPPSVKDLWSRKKLLSNYPEIPNAPYFIFLGRLHYIKGVDILIKAFSKYKKSKPKTRHHLVIAGPNGGELNNIKHLIKKYKLTDTVHLIGALDDKSKFSVLKHGGAFILPSRLEGFGIAVLEALVTSVPVIISYQTNFPEVKKNNAGLTVRLKIQDLAKAMLTLSKKPNYAKKLGENGRRLVLKNYTWEKIANQMISLYKTL